MAISYSDLVEKLLIDARDIMRADSTLCTKLGTTTVLSVNTIFAMRPVDQRKGFTNPRVVVETPIHTPIDYSENPEGHRNDNVQFQITAWVNENPITTAPQVMERIRTIFDKKDFSTTEGGKGYYDIQSAEYNVDPDKPATMQCRVLINAELITKR